MKKIYMAPLTEVVKINAEQMICDSVANFLPQINKGETVSGGDVLDKEEDELLDVRKALTNDVDDEMEDLW